MDSTLYLSEQVQNISIYEKQYKTLRSKQLQEPLHYFVRSCFTTDFREINSKNLLCYMRYTELNR